MNLDIHNLREYIHDHPLEYGSSDIQALLDLLAHYCLLFNPIEPDDAPNLLESLQPILAHLSRKRQRLIYRIINQTADAYSKAAFQQGILAGIRLLLEIFDIEI